MWSGGRSGAGGEEGGLAGCVWDGEPQHTRHGGPKPANYAAQGSQGTCQSLPERRCGKPQEGPCAWGLPRKRPRGLRRSGHLPASRGGFQHPAPGGSSCRRGPSLRGSLSLCQAEVSGASEAQDAHSRNSSEPTTLVFGFLDLRASLRTLLSFFPCCRPSMVTQDHPERAR